MDDSRNHRDRGAWELDNAGMQTLAAPDSLRHDRVAQPSPQASKPEDRISVFWRFFGGTLLSIAGLILITVYQQVTSSFSEFRNNLNHLNESSRDLVKIDDFNTRFTSTWGAIKDLQTANATVMALKERSTLLEQQLKATQDQLNARSTSVSLGLKELETTQASVSAVRERLTLLEQQLKTSDDERKDLTHELQRVRERLAAVEGKQAAVTTSVPERSK